MQDLWNKILYYLQTHGIFDISLTAVDVVEILLIAILLYYILRWAKSTRAWNLFKGILVVLVFVLIATIFQMNTILWIARNAVNVVLIALVILFQPELRSALENLGRNRVGKILTGKDADALYFESIADELVKAAFAMGRAKTGALIVLEGRIRLDDYIRTGIALNADVSCELLLNIFEKNTPLHDGAVIIRNDRIAAATCYLPLSENTNLGKELGTRHRAAVGISEVSDSLTIVVSEETGDVSVASGGVIDVKHDKEALLSSLVKNRAAKAQSGEKKKKRRSLNGQKNSESSDL